MDLQVRNLEVIGRISFSDNSYLDRKVVRAIHHVSQFERNEGNGTLSLLNDNLIVNKALTVQQEINTLLARVRNVTYLNDLDDTGQPITQTIGFTGELRDRIHQLQSNLDSIIPDILDPATKTLHLNGGHIAMVLSPSEELHLRQNLFSVANHDGNYTEMSSDGLYIKDYTHTNSEMTITKNGIVSTNITNGSYFQIDNGVESSVPAMSFIIPNVEEVAITSKNVQVVMTNGPNCTLSAGDLFYQSTDGLLNSGFSYQQMYLNNNNNGTHAILSSEVSIMYDDNHTSELTSYQIRFNEQSKNSILDARRLQLNDDDQQCHVEILTVDEDSGTYTPAIKLAVPDLIPTYIKQDGISVDRLTNFTFSNNEGFMKLLSPVSYDVRHLRDGDYIEYGYPFILCDHAGEIRLHSVGGYFDTGGKPGWSTLVSNFQEMDLQINITDDRRWYSRSHGLRDSPIYIEKFATARITLIYSPDREDYFWAVSQF